MIFAILQVALTGECLKNWRAGIQVMLWTKMLILHDWDTDTVLRQNQSGLLMQDSEEIVGLQVYRKIYFYYSQTTMKHNDRL